MSKPQHFLLGLMKMMAAPDFDAERFGESETFAGIVENQKLMPLRNEACEEVLA